MYIFKVMIVDDEPHAVETVVSMLERIDEFSLDVYRAKNYSEAISILERGRMDLVITDIEMPGKNGLALVEQIRSRWPQCRILILTAFSQFQYAYSAIQLKVDGYILKTEEDDDVIDKVTATLRDIQKVIREDAQSAEKQAGRQDMRQNQRLLQLLSHCSADDSRALYQECGLSADSSAAYLILVQATDPTIMKESSVIDEIIRRFTDVSAAHSLYAVADAYTGVWLLDAGQAIDPIANARIVGAFELIQQACLDVFANPLSILIQPFRKDQKSFDAVYQESKNRLQRMTGRPLSVPFLFCAPPNDIFEMSKDESVMDTTLDWLCQYIDENITRDVSLVQLSYITGYNAQYLSYIFHQRKNVTITQYIAQKRMDAIRALLADTKISIQDVSRRMGFSSHSYFSRYVRQESGMTPQQLRINLLKDALS